MGMEQGCNACEVDTGLTHVSVCFLQLGKKILLPGDKKVPQATHLATRGYGCKSYNITDDNMV
jgi:hypothetical protein